MVTLLRLLFWPILLLLLEVASWAFRWDLWGAIYVWFTKDPLEALFGLLTAYLVFHSCSRWIRFSYALWMSRKLVSMKVMLQRNDSKIDQEKRTEKDFKEKVAVMEQLYLALWEVKALTFWRFMHFWIFRYATISFEMFLERGELTFYVLTQPNLVSIVEKQITAFYSDAEVTIQKTPDIWDKGMKLVGYNMQLKKKFCFPVRYYEEMQDDPLNDITNVLSKTEPDETATIQVILTPAFSDRWSKQVKRYASMKFKGKEDRWVSRIPLLSTLVRVLGGVATGTDGSTLAPGASHGDSFIRMIQPEEELYKRMGQKAGMSGFHCTIRVMAAAKSWHRALDITNNMQVAYNVFKDVYGNWFMNRRVFVDFFPLAWNAPIIHWLWKHRINGFFSKRPLLVERELAGLYHFPDSRYNKIPIIQWITYKVLPPPPNLPQEGIQIGVNRHRATETPIRFSEKDRTRHEYIIGKSGCGKSALLSYQARQDVAAGGGLCVVDPHGDLIEDVLAHVPKERAKDVIVFDPADMERPMGLNLLEAKTDVEKDRASLDAMEIFIKLFGNEIFGPRIQHYFRNGCLTLMDDEEEGATLIDVPRLFVDDEFQRYKVSKCKNVIVRNFWEHEIAKTGAREKEEMIPYFSAKFGPFVTNTTMRNIIGQPKSAFNIREIMDEGKILLVNLSKGKIGDVNAQLLGLIFVNKVNMAALSRADMPMEDRKRFYI
ncbi:MAG: hypothetical protein AAB489_04510, partial [Patescibacteria group bacterium]